MKQVLSLFGVFWILAPSFSFCTPKQWMNESWFREADWLKCWRKSTDQIEKVFNCIFEIPFLKCFSLYIVSPKCLKHDKTMEDYYWRQVCFSTQVTVKSIYPNSFSPTTFRLNLLHYSELYFIPSPHAPSAVKIWSVIDPLWESICTYRKSHHLYTKFRNKERQFVLNTFLIQLVFIVYIEGTLVLTNRNRGVTNEI